MEQPKVNEEKCCGWCDKFNTSECAKLFTKSDNEEVCDNYEYGLPFNNE